MKVGFIRWVVCLTVANAAIAQQEPPADRKAVEELYARGGAALRLGDAKAALADLLDARSVLPKGPASAADARRIDHAIAVAYMGQGRYDKAGPVVARSIAVRPAARNEIYNLGVYDLRTRRDVVRSLKFIHDYLAAQKTIDEPMVILFGACLDLAAEQKMLAGGTNKMDAYAAAFTTRQKALEAARPGRYLWGAEWIDAARKKEIDAETKKVNEAIARYDRNEVQPARAAVERYKRRSPARSGNCGPTASCRAALRARTISPRPRSGCRRRRAKSASCKRTIPRPDFPKELPPAHPDFALGANGAGVTPAVEKPSPTPRPEGSKPIPPVRPPAGPHRPCRKRRRACYA
jgi:tetratricopeptide (TPR) repeat protein